LLLEEQFVKYVSGISSVSESLLLDQLILVLGAVDIPLIQPHCLWNCLKCVFDSVLQKSLLLVPNPAQTLPTTSGIGESATWSHWSRIILN
jgi:hypothetical protein